MRALLLALGLGLAAPAQALELTFRGAYDLNRPASLEFDPDFCGLWIANEGPDVALVTLDGLELKRLSSDLFRIKAMAIVGRDLLVTDGLGRFQRLSRTGGPRGAVERREGLYDTEGMVALPGGGIALVEDDPERLVWLDDAGNIVRELSGLDVEPTMIEPQGIARDDRNGHLLVVDDWEGRNALFEFDADGTVLSVTPLIRWGRDPEGLALREATGALFVAFDQGARVAAFDYVPTGGARGSAPQDCAMM